MTGKVTKLTIGSSLTVGPRFQPMKFDCGYEVSYPDGITPDEAQEAGKALAAQIRDTLERDALAGLARFHSPAVAQESLPGVGTERI